LSYYVAHRLGGPRVAAATTWPGRGLVHAGSAAALQRDGHLTSSRSRQLTNAAFAFVAVAAAATTSMLIDGHRLSPPTLRSLEAGIDSLRPEVEPVSVPHDESPAAAPVQPVAEPSQPAADQPAVSAGPSPAITVALTSALAVRGVPYVWGGESPKGFDCSGLVQWAYRKAGIQLPRTSQQQSRVGEPVSPSNLRAGDLVFFYNPVHHVAIYLGNGMVLQAPQTGDVVKISSLSRMPIHNVRRVA